MATTFPTGTYGHMIVNTPGIVHFMRLNDTSGAGDDADGLSGSSYAVTHRQAGALVGDENTSAYFNGSSSYITFGNNVNLVGAFSVEIWIKPGKTYAAGQTPTFLSKENYTYPVSGWSWYLDSMTPTFTRMNGDQWRVKSPAISAGVWTHLVVTYDGSTLRQYKNGDLVWDTPSPGSIYTSAYPCLMGAATNGQIADRYASFQGHLDEFAVYNRAISASTVLDHYNRGITSPIQNLKDSASVTLRLTGTGERVSIETTRDTSESVVLRSTETTSFFNTLTVSENLSIITTEQGVVDTTFAGILVNGSTTGAVNSTETASIFTTVQADETVTLYNSEEQLLNAFMSVSETVQLKHTEGNDIQFLLDINRDYPQLVKRRQGFIHFAAQRKFNGNISIQSEHLGFVPARGEQASALGSFILGQSKLGSDTIAINAVSELPFLVKNDLGLPVGLGYARTNWIQGSVIVDFYDDMSEHTDILRKFGFTASYSG